MLYSRYASHAFSPEIGCLRSFKPIQIESRTNPKAPPWRSLPCPHELRQDGVGAQEGETKTSTLVRTACFVKHPDASTTEAQELNGDHDQWPGGRVVLLQAADPAAEPLFAVAAPLLILFLRGCLWLARCMPLRPVRPSVD